MATRCLLITTSCGSATCCTPATPTWTQWTPGSPGLSSFRASFLRHQASIVVALVCNILCSVELYGFSGWQLEKVLSAMRQPFPEMVYLLLHCEDDTAPGHSRFLHEWMCPSSAVSRVGTHPISGITETNCYLPLHLIKLHLYYYSSFRVYFTPEVMATGLFMLTGLETLSLQFQTPSISPRLRRSTSTSDDTLCPPGSYVIPV